MATINDSTIRAIKQRFGIVGESPALIAAIRRAMLVAPIDLSVLIIGESGSGKESFPKIIHESSPRKHSRAPSPALLPTIRVTLRRPTAASSSWTKSPRCP